MSVAVVKESAKAIVGGLTAVVGSLAVAASDGSISLAEWLIGASAGLAAVGAVWGVPNAGGADGPKHAAEG